MSEIAPFSSPSYGFFATPFGECCLAFSDDGIYSLTFPESKESGLLELKRRFPGTDFVCNEDKAATLGTQIFVQGKKPVLFPIGTPFQRTVWAALQTIPKGETTTYAHIAKLIGRPKALRAVGTAIGANPIAFLIPCHRVVKSDGRWGGFRWGVACKMALLESEK
jgi:AraC family transcriptional regulator of adaptative response/methylated-DNA-[protein]-cysteine methyltransferase